MTLRAILLALLPALLLSACSRSEPDRAPAMVFTDEHPRLTLTLHEEPRKLTEVPVTVTLGEPEGHPTVTDIVARVDMPGMPMNVAPVILQSTGARKWEGVLVFTMSGPWYIELEVFEGEESWSVRYDVSVP